MKLAFLLCAVVYAVAFTYGVQQHYYYVAAAMVVLGLTSLIEYAKA